MNNLKNTIRPYQNYSLTKMLRLKFFFTLCKYNVIVNNLSKIYDTSAKILTTKGVNNLIGHLYGDILLGGMSVTDLENCVRIQKQEKITCISGFIREGLTVEEEKEVIDDVIDTHIKSIDLMNKYDPENFIAIKISCFCNKDGLKKLNELQRDLILIEDYFHSNSTDLNALKSKLISKEAQKNINDNIEIMREKLFGNSKTKFTINLYEIISNKENEKLAILNKLFGDNNNYLIDYGRLIDERLHKVINHASTKKVSILMDAEESYFQNIIDNMIMHYMKIYNKDYSLLLHTIQQYLKGGPKALDEFIDFVRGHNLKFGLKMVKGAYLKIETKMALENGYENPVNDNIEQTQDNYHKGVDKLFTILRPDEKVTN